MTVLKRLLRPALTLAVVAAGTLVLGLAACEESNGPGEGGVKLDMKHGDGASTSGCSAAISGNHGHTISIPKGDLEAAASEKTFTLDDGGAGHTHTIKLSPSQQMQLLNGGMASVVSSNSGGHTHNVTVMCS